ncbi:LOW QUALITY PROTEIN: reverse transcriptase [Phytophthora megakarya]|uniref:Reverse transcriptase n=1 Tax=Phytophthora megakarya TaxID=4795 RepID=A0A225W2K0_9STRA|nr:LOW QUALITY PROTEIN: reverse transcriptase [Phytophthora megakarya]
MAQQPLDANMSNTSSKHWMIVIWPINWRCFDLEETLRARQLAKAPQGKVHAGSNKYRQKSTPENQSVPAKNARSVRAIQKAEDSSVSESDASGLEQEDECRRVYLVESKGWEIQAPTPVHQDNPDHTTMSQKNCAHCGSTKHDNLGCWKRLKCQKCGRKGHPSDHCIFVCRACEEMHDSGKCPMEEFYNLIRQWYKQEKPEVSKQIDNTCELHKRPTFAIANLRKDDYSRTDVVMELDLLPGESRGYWKYHASGKGFKQAKSTAKINNEGATLLFDSGAEISIVDSTFARKVGCTIDNSQRQECVGIGENAYMTEGRTRIKITLAGTYVYYFDAWVGDLTGQKAILGMYFMVPAGILLDLADGSLCLPDEVRIQLSGHRQLFSRNSRVITFAQHGNIPVAGSVEICGLRSLSDEQKLWVTRGDRWVPTVVRGPGRTQYLRITNVSTNNAATRHPYRDLDHVPRTTGYVSVGSRRYAEWQNLAFQTTADETPIEDSDEVVAEPLDDRPQYNAPTEISKKEPKPRKLMSIQPSPCVETKIEEPAAGGEPLKPEPDDADHVTTEGTRVDQEQIEPRDQVIQLRRSDQAGALVKPDREVDDDMDDAVCYHEGGDIFPEAIENHMAVLPEVEATTREVTIDDIRVEDPDATPEECERVRRIIWKRRHLLIRAGNALPPPRCAWGDLRYRRRERETGSTTFRRVAPQFREKLFMLIKGLLSATIIAPSISPWKPPLHIRLCIDYQVVNSLTRLMVYPMALVNDLLEDLGKWILGRVHDAAGETISAFITPFGLFEWARMPFGLKNAPQIYQRIVDNTLYGHMRIKPGQDKTFDVFEEGEPNQNLNRRSWDGDPKRYWGRCKVTYLGHQVSTEGLEAKPKDLEAFSNLPFPTKLKSMQSFLGSLNYYNRFIEDFAVYAAILYELREVEYYLIARLKSTGEPEEGAAPAGEERDRWTRAMNAFTILKAKIISTPILKHFDPGRAQVIVLYANSWAISATLMQEHSGVYWPVTFTSRTLKANELNYAIVDKEVLALLRMLDICYSQLIT